MAKDNSGIDVWIIEMKQLLNELVSDHIHQMGWVNGSTEEVYSWSDFVVEILDVHLSEYFLDYGLKQIGFSEILINHFKELCINLNSIVDKYGIDDSIVESVLSDPSFQQLMEDGKKIINLFTVECNKLFSDTK